MFNHQRQLYLGIGLALILLICGFGAGLAMVDHAQAQEAVSRQHQTADSHASRKRSHRRPSTKSQQKATPKHTAQPANWQKPSQTTPYPTVTAAKPVELEVSLKRQRVYVRQGGKRVYTMYCSTGMNDSTPRGTFHIITRGHSFYNPRERMGANYWTSFIGTTYLFHTVPTDRTGHYILAQTRFLGIRPSSHGCVRLSVPDAQWINAHIPAGTKVVIK